MKQFKLLFILLLVCGLYSCDDDNTIPEEPTNPPEVDIEIPITNTIGTLVNKRNDYDGYTLFTPSKSTETYLINNCGQILNQWSSNFKSGKSVYLLENGSILRAGEIKNPDIKIGGIGGQIEIFDWDNNLTWSYQYSSTQFSHHHDAVPLPNGNILLLVATRKTEDEAIAIGRDPLTIADGELYNEQIIEIKPIGTNEIDIVWVWNVWDHLIQDFDNTKENFGSVSENPNLLDINFVGRSANKPDWLHSNSIQYNESLDQIVISFQGTSEIFIIDHSTTSIEAATDSGGNSGKGGDILYRWGNPMAYKTGTENDRTLFGQHYPHWIPENYIDGGKLLIFNNGLDRDGDFSTIEIISPPMNSSGDYILNAGSSFGPTESEWTYTKPNFLSEIISSAQRLPNGNTLICEGIKGHFFEIDEDQEVVWEYINPESSEEILTQGDTPIDNAVFRAFKYDLEYAAFNNRDLTPGDPLELNFNIGNCN